MTNDSGKEVTAHTWVRDRIVTKVTDWLIVGVLGFLAVTLFAPLRERVVAVWNTPKTMMSVEAQISSLSDQVDVVSTEVRKLKQPTKVFDISLTNTKPINGFCVEAQPCPINIRVWRTLEGETCKIIPKTSQWGFVNPRTDTYVSAVMISGGVARDIGRQYEDIQVTLLTPEGLEPEADFVFTTFYSNCPGTLPGDEPLAYNSQKVRFVIKDNDQ